jgi:hypothetical protein
VPEEIAGKIPPFEQNTIPFDAEPRPTVAKVTNSICHAGRKSISRTKASQPAPGGGKPA